jgi:hypothetical protein
MPVCDGATQGLAGVSRAVRLRAWRNPPSATARHPTKAIQIPGRRSAGAASEGGQ